MDAGRSLFGTGAVGLYERMRAVARLIVLGAAIGLGYRLVLRQGWPRVAVSNRTPPNKPLKVASESVGVIDPRCWSGFPGAGRPW